jgi:hypothetical protein
MYDLQGNRDIAYSGKVYPGVSDALVIAGVSTTPPGPGSTGLDFFALMVDTNNGDRKTSFGTNGFVKIDFGNINGTSRTDVATEVVFLTQPHRIAVLGESVVSKIGATNLSFAIAMIDSNGAPVTSFGTNGLALYDIDSGANDEIFFGDVDEQNNLLVGGFANPTPTTGAGPAFNCAVLKVNQFGVRDVNWGQNGQVIIDFNGWDERCRAGLPMNNSIGQTAYYMIGGRSKPAPGFNTTLVNGSLPNPPVLNTPTHDQNNFRATMTNVVYRDGTFNPLFGAGDYDFGFGRKVINANNGSFETIKMIQASRGFSAVMDNDGIHQTMNAADGDVISLGNWGGWDNGISGNKAIGLMKWNADGERLDRRWGNGGITSINPARFGGQSYDSYSLRPYRQHIYVVGGVKATAASASPPRSIVARFWAYNGRPDLTFGVNAVYLAPQLTNSTSSLYKSLDIVNHAAHIVGEVGVAPSTSADVNVLYARYNLHQW